LDVVSEELRYAFMGRISVAGNGPSGEKSPFGGDAIPLVATIYRRSAIWGLCGAAKRENTLLKQPVLQRARVSVADRGDRSRAVR
jgi:hypothetical protein